MRLKILRGALAAFLALAGVFAFAVPAAQANPIAPVSVSVAQMSPPAACTSWSPWFGASETGWGQFRWCSSVNDDNGNYWYRFQVDDTITDGYAVHLEVASAETSCCYPSWVTWLYADIIYDDSNYTQCFQSTGAVATSGWYGTWTPGAEGYTHIDVKLVRGRVCGTGGHQNTASWTKHLIG